MQKGLYEITRLSKCVIFRELSTKKIIMNSFIISQFGYCPLYGCAVTEKPKSRSINSTKELYIFYIQIIHRLLMNCLRNLAPLAFTTEVYSNWLLKSKGPE